MSLRLVRLLVLFSGLPSAEGPVRIIHFYRGFRRNHADSIANLLIENSYYHLYLVPARLKPRLRTILRERHGIWRGSCIPTPLEPLQLRAMFSIKK